LKEGRGGDQGIEDLVSSEYLCHPKGGQGVGKLEATKREGGKGEKKISTKKSKLSVVTDYLGILGGGLLLS